MTEFVYFLREREEIFFTYLVQLPFELPVQIPVQLLLELDKNVNEIEFELSRRWIKRPFIILAKVFMYIRCIF